LGSKSTIKKRLPNNLSKIKVKSLVLTVVRLHMQFQGGKDLLKYHIAKISSAKKRKIKAGKLN
jgi:hypothetical protein